MFRFCKTFFAALTFTVLCLASAGIVQADTITFHADRTAFNAATASQTTLTFEGFVSDSGTLGPNTSLTVSGVTFSTTLNGNPHPAVFIIGANANSGRSALNSASLTAFIGSSSGGINLMTITLPTGGATAIGMDLGFFVSQSVNITLSNGQMQTVALNGHSPANSRFVANPVFFGFTSDVAITSLTFSLVGPSSLLLLDNFSFGTAITTTPQPTTPTPEPTTMLLLGTGLAGVAAKVSRRRKATKA